MILICLEISVTPYQPTTLFLLSAPTIHFLSLTNCLSVCLSFLDSFPSSPYCSFWFFFSISLFSFLLYEMNEHQRGPFLFFHRSAVVCSHHLLSAFPSFCVCVCRARINQAHYTKLSFMSGGGETFQKPLLFCFCLFFFLSQFSTHHTLLNISSLYNPLIIGQCNR